MSYNLPAIRELIKVALTTTEFNALLFDDFHSVYDETDGQPLPDRRIKLVDRANKQRKIPELLKAIQKCNPKVYEEFKDELIKQGTGNNKTASNQPGFIDWTDSTKRKIFREALQRVYPNEADLRRFVDEELNENLAVIAPNANLQRIAFELINWARAKGKLDDVFAAFCRENLNDPVIDELQQQSATVQPKPDMSSPSASPAPADQSANEPMEVFISYSHKDDDLREEFVTHLANLKRQGKITAWHDRAIEAGEEWEAQIKGKLESARIILLLISPPFMASDYCYDIEMQRAIERHDTGTARVIPIILRPCDWKGSPFSKLQVLPKDAKPVTQWGDRDTAFLNVVEGIRRAVDSLAKS